MPAPPCAGRTHRRRLGGSAARRLGGSAARRLGGSAARRLGGSAARRLGGSAARRLGGSAARRLGGSAARRLGGSAARRLGGSAARRLGGSAARRLGGSAARRLGGHYRPSPCGDCQPPERTFLRRMPQVRRRALTNPVPARQSAHGRVHPSKAIPAHGTRTRGRRLACQPAPTYRWYTQMHPQVKCERGGGDALTPLALPAAPKAVSVVRLSAVRNGHSPDGAQEIPPTHPRGFRKRGPAGPCRTANPALPAARRGGSLRNMCGGTRALR